MYSKLKEQEVALLKILIQDNSENLDYNIINIPRSTEFCINLEIEADKWNLTHISIITKADHHGELILLQSFNLEARRLVLCLLDDNYEINIYTQADDSQIIYMKSPNLLDGIIISDIESVIVSILYDSLQKEHKKLREIFTYFQKNNNLPPIRFNLLKELLLNKRRTLFVLHNASCTIEQLITSHRNAKGNLSSLHSLNTKRVKTDNSISSYLYSFNFSNLTVGFYFSLSSKEIGKYKFCYIKISPAKRGSSTLTYTCDLTTLANVFQEKSTTLFDLSANSNYPKIDNKDDKKAVAIICDFPNPIIVKSIPEKELNAIIDSFSIIAIYAKLSNRLNLAKLENLLGLKIEKTNIPFCAKIRSAATIGKHILRNYLVQKLNRDLYIIQKNIKKSHNFLQNYKQTYLGGKVECFIHGLVETTLEQKIYYLDFTALYPHAAWICEALWLYLVCSKNEIHKYIRNDINTVIKRIKLSVNEIIESIIKKKPLQKRIFQRLVGNCTIHSDILVQLPRDFKNKKVDMLVKGKISTTLVDLSLAIVREIITNKRQIDKVLSQISFIKVEYVDIPVSSEYGKEFFTILCLFRKKIKAEIIEIKENLKKGNSAKITILECEQLFVKILMNACCGISGEGMLNEKYTGIFCNLIVANAISTIGRAFITVAEITVDHINALKIYTDTDSIFVRATKTQQEYLLSIFQETILLKDEIEDKYKDEDYITHIYIAGKKKYGYKTSKGRIVFTTHSKGQYLTEPFKKALKESYKYLFTPTFTEDTTDKAGEIASHYHSYLQNVTLNSQKSSIYTGLRKFNERTITAYTWQWEGIPIYVKFNLSKGSYLVTNTRQITKGLTGDYLNITKGKNKLIFFITIPIDVDKLISDFIKKFDTTNEDILFRKQKTTNSLQGFYCSNNTYYLQYLLNDHIGFERKKTVKYYKNYWLDVYYDCKINNKEPLGKKELLLWEQLTNYNNLEEIKKQAAFHIHSWYSQETNQLIFKKSVKEIKDLDFNFLNHPTYQLYQNILSEVCKGVTITKIIQNSISKIVAGFQTLDVLIDQLVTKIENKEHIKRRMQNYFQYNEHKITRDIAEYKETFIITKPQDDKVNDEEIQNIKEKS